MGIPTSKSDNSLIKYLKNYSPSNFSSSIIQEKSHYIILTSNTDFQKILNDQDNSELSTIGIEKAKDTGIQLKLNLLGINFSEINIFSSPDIHNIQTLLYMVNIIDYDDSSNKILFINKNLSDDINLSLDYNTAQDLMFKEPYNQLIMPLCKEKKYILNKNDFNEISNTINKEETKDDISNRFSEITKSIYQYILNKYSNSTSNSLNIICTNKEHLNIILSKIISIMNIDEEKKINIEINKEPNIDTTYCFKISLSQEKIFNYLGKLVQRKIETDKNLNKNKKINNRFIGIMRHGERIDNTNMKKNQELPKYDPELTYEGMKQAINIGYQLLNYLNEQKIEINDINIFNSPSWRTLQTGILTAGSFDYSDKIEKVIRIITDLNETSVQGGFENNKEESPIYYYKNKDKLLHNLYDKYITKLIKDRNYRYGSLDFTSILGKDALEDGETMKKRAQNVITNINSFSRTSYNQGENTLNIVATHQLNVAMIIEFLFDELNKEYKNKGLDEIKIIDQSFGYCHCYLFKYDENEQFSFVGLFKPGIYWYSLEILKHLF